MPLILSPSANPRAPAGNEIIDLYLQAYQNRIGSHHQSPLHVEIQIEESRHHLSRFQPQWIRIRQAHQEIPQYYLLLFRYLSVIGALNFYPEEVYLYFQFVCALQRWIVQLWAYIAYCCLYSKLV